MVVVEYCYTYDTNIKVDSSGEIVFTQENEYNQDGIRISKKEGSSAKYYYYDRGSVASTKSGSDITSCNVIGIEGNAIGTVRDEENTEKYYVYNKDVQGSTISITAEDGSIAASYDYSDFGVATERQKSSIENEICYTGAIYDSTTSLYYMNARYYDLSTGRFISEDTYRGEDNNYDQWHLYAYCANNPINYVDPSGHKKIRPGTVEARKITMSAKQLQKIRDSYNAQKEAFFFRNYIIKIASVGSIANLVSANIKKLTAAKAFLKLVKNSAPVAAWGIVVDRAGALYDSYLTTCYNKCQKVLDKISAGQYGKNYKIVFSKYMKYTRHGSSGYYWVPTGKIDCTLINQKG